MCHISLIRHVVELSECPLISIRKATAKEIFNECILKKRINLVSNSFCSTIPIGPDRPVSSSIGSLGLGRNAAATIFDAIDCRCQINH